LGRQREVKVLKSNIPSLKSRQLMVYVRLALIGGAVWLIAEFFVPDRHALSQTDWIVLGVGIFIAWGLNTIHDRLNELQDRLTPNDDEDESSPE
jgi:hypothetical protein